ncbi:hypothetical protein [Streptomyces sp. PT12]|uniref:hypothetical protein n=1 Tax=Streptomyces sp. PT12 TaxID=1510197 RepID=UPI0011BE2178|nr:hypothetical protein [Streptomyces sp. PT12]
MAVDETLSADWLRAPAAPPPDEATLGAFDRLLDRAGLVLHGSDRADLRELTPRRCGRWPGARWPPRTSPSSTGYAATTTRRSSPESRPTPWASPGSTPENARRDLKAPEDTGAGNACFAPALRGTRRPCDTTTS